MTALQRVTDTGEDMTLELEVRQAPAAETSDIQDKARQTLYLLNRFAVSDECYHELAQVHMCCMRRETNHEQLSFSCSYAQTCPGSTTPRD